MSLVMNKIISVITEPFRKILKAISLESYVKLQYRFITGHKLNLQQPTRYTEKLQHLRLYEYPNNPLVCKCAGRVGAREYIKEKGYENLLIKSYGVFNSFDEIDFNKLPKSFVIKTTHSSQMNQIVWNKDELNIKKLKKKISKFLKINYGKKTGEMHYSNIVPQILVEELLIENGTTPIEYKIHCFNGKAKYMYIVTGRGNDIHYDNFYIEWTRFDGAQFNGWTSSNTEIKKPNNWNEMVSIAETLAKDFPFVRVDLYNVDGKIYFSELTYTPAKGTLKFDDDKVDFEIGKWLDISAK